MDSRVEGLRPLYQYSRGCERRSRETVKESESSDRRRTRVARSPILGIRASKVREGSHSTSQVANPRENCSLPSEEDIWQRSRDLVSLEVHRVRAQELGVPSHEVVKLRGARIVVRSR
jgi:hypothetical protein